MTIAATPRKAGPFSGNDVATEFPFSFRVFGKSDLAVILTGAGGGEATLTLDSHYSVALNDDQDANPGGTVTYPVSGDPLATGETLTVIGSLPESQETDITNGGGFFPQVIEDRFDYITALVQQLREEINRTVRLPPSDAGSSLLPTPAQRANTYLAFGANGVLEVAASVGSTALSRSAIGQLLHPVYGGEITGSIPISDYGVPVANVVRYGAVRTSGNTTDSSAAFLYAWQAIKETGGILLVPPGDYYLNAQWLMDVDLTAPRNYEIYAYGATIRSGPSVEDFAVRIYKGYNYSGVKLRGLHIDHRGNAAALGGVQLMGALNTRLTDVQVEMHGNAAGWAGFELAPHTAGNGTTHSFWAVLDQCSVRKRSGTDGGADVYSHCGIRLKGQANAATIRNCRLNSVTHGILMETDGAVGGHANGVVIRDNAFEGVTNGITIDTDAPADNMPAGLRITDNRIESATTFVNVTGAAINDHTHPPILRGNYVGPASVTNTLVNPNNQRFRVYEPSYFGLSDYDNIVGGPNNYHVICQGAGKHFRVSNESGTSNYNGAHIIIGGHHLWVETATGKLRIKSSAPSADDDGTVVGAQTA